MGIFYSAMGKPDTRLPPRGILQPFTITLTLAPPFEGEMKVKVIGGCGQSESFKYEISKNAENFEKIYTRLIRNESLETEDPYDFWGIEKPGLARRFKK